MSGTQVEKCEVTEISSKKITAKDFKYFGSTERNNKNCGKEVKNCVQAGWKG